jgi:MSHA biogenesis protein MshN
VDEQAAAKPAPLGRTSGNEGRTLQDTPAQAYRQGNAGARSADGLPSPFKVVSPKQQSANLYRQAVESIQQSRTAEAQQALRQSLAADSGNDDARLLLAELLTNDGSNGEATTLLRAGLDGASGRRAGASGLAMALARLQVAGGARTEALATLEHGLAGAADDAEYHAFLAALLQGQGRHAEAAQHYITALRSDPAMPSWLVGVGISLQAENKLSDAREAFQRALDTEELSPEVARFANERLQQLRRAR